MHNALNRKSSIFDSPSIRAKGSEVDGVRIYKGIPYAQAPVGLMRFAPPLPLTRQAGTFDAREFGSIAMQDHILQAPELFSWLTSSVQSSEDCLSLNIYAPTDETEKWPVIVYIHGGGFAHGSSSAPVLDGSYIAKTQKIVVVTVNHRLNVFGHFAMGTFADDLPLSANLGLLDLVASLKWIKDNIAFAGGDPENVTIMGQSGGAGKVALLMCISEAKGLFHRAIMQSPASSFSAQSAETAAVGGRAIMDYLGIAPSDVKSLRHVDAGNLFQAYKEAVKAQGGYDSFRPSVDNTILFQERGGLRIQTYVPTLLGYTDTEASFYLARQIKDNEINYTTALNRIAGFLLVQPHKAAKLLRAYAECYPDFSWAKLLSQIAGDQLFKMQTLDAAKRLICSGNQHIYLYKFSFDAGSHKDYIGSPHTGDIPFVFGNLDVPGTYIDGSPACRRVMLQMTEAWANFARTGKPGCELLPEWPRYDMSGKKTMVIDRCAALEPDPDACALKLLEPIERYVPGSPFTFIRD